MIAPPPGSIAERLLVEALRIRLVEERIAALYPSDRIQSPVHLCIGQEAVAAGACSVLRPTDLLFATYRSHGFYLAKGGSLRGLFAELFGKATGCAGGKGGSMHLAAPEVGFMGTSAIVASTIPHAVGAALAAVRLGKDQVVMSAFGDGAADEGVYHESLNFAALHRLPVLFLCENNGLAVHAPRGERQAFQIAPHARAYAVPAVVCETGQDPLAVREACESAVAEVRAGRGPRLVEVRTFRYREHVGPNEDFAAGYRLREEMERWAASDPLAALSSWGDRYRPEIIAEIDAAVAFAEASPVPPPAHLLADVL